MPAHNPLRIPALLLAAVAAFCALLLALFDWSTALTLVAALALGWALVLASAIGTALYRRHRMAVLGAGAVVLVTLAVVFRPDGSGGVETRAPMPVSGYAAELWPNRLASQGAFILRERVDIGAGEVEDGADGRANVEPVETGPLMRELRFVPGAGVGLQEIRLIDDGEAKVIVNPIENAEVHHAIGGAVSRVTLPLGPVVQIEFEELPGRARVAYLVGAGRSLAPIASLVTPLRRMPRVYALLLFALVGGFAAFAWRDRMIKPLQRRFTEKPKPPAPAAPGRPGAPIERAPLIPRRK